MNFELNLNENQLKAVTTARQYVRVIAGAGTGKTRVLTYRIIYLVSTLMVDPYNILAITFTNKAAKEMLNRMNRFDDTLERKLWIHTFHGFCARFLRNEIEVLGMRSNFAIFDELDQETLIKNILKEKGYNRTSEETKTAIRFIQENKGAGLLPEHAITHGVPTKLVALMKEVFQNYEAQKETMNALDFDDLLIKTLQILANYPEIQAKWQRRFRHLLVDEFQDTNDLQYRLIRLLMDETTALYVVGDPDQTIYTWRGARQEIIINFEKEFPDLETIVLDTNYRSTQEILDVANKLISHNKNRIHKDLSAHAGGGLLVEVQTENNDLAEAGFVCRKIRELKRQGYDYRDIAILYRANYLTRPLERQLMNQAIPYVVYGDVKFYQRMEIKDILAYFTLANDALNNLAFLRIINVPRRGIGDVTLKQIEEGALAHRLSLAEYVRSSKSDNQVPSKALLSLREMLSHIEELQVEINNYATDQSGFENQDNLKSAFLEFINSIGYQKHLEATEENADDRMDNIKSLIEDILYFMRRDFNNKFSDYLQNVSLMSHQDDIDNSDHVSLMTVHIAKGLEYPVVLVFGFNEGVFPSQRSIFEGGVQSLEEERRLAYVAFTRAMKKLFITYNTGHSFVNNMSLSPSTFLNEAAIEVKPRQSMATYREFFEKQKKHFAQANTENYENAVKVSNEETWRVGDRIDHVKYGKGSVIQVDPYNNNIDVMFDNGETKKLMGSHPSIKKEN